MREIIIKKVGEKYKIPKFLRYRLWNHTFKLEYNGKLYDKEIKDNKEVRQISLLVEACNIKNRKKRIEFIYDRSCDLFDDDFYGCNLCEFKNNQCFVNRMHGKSLDGCCRSRDNKSACKYLIKHRCTNRNLACKLHICSFMKNRGYKYRLNDILMIKYLYSWKQKVFCYFNLFISRERFLKDLYQNSFILWGIKPRRHGIVKDKNYLENIK